MPATPHDYTQLCQQQRQWSEQLVLTSPFSLPEQGYIAGADVGFEEEGNVVRAVIAVLHYPSFALVEYQIARVPTALPYIPGLLSFREVPGLLAAWQQLTTEVQLVVVDGQGIAHPRRLGVASHFGLLIDKPTIGVAKKRLTGKFTPLAESPQQCQPLWDKQQQQIGWVWQSKARCNPLFISPGNCIDLGSALHCVQQLTQGYRLPEPTRWADAIASQRPVFLRWQNLNK